MLPTQQRLKNRSPSRIALQATFFSRLTLAHLATCAAAIFRRAAADIICLTGLAAVTLLPCTFAQRALCAAAMLARPLADNFRRGLLPLLPR